MSAPQSKSCGMSRRGRIDTARLVVETRAEMSNPIDIAVNELSKTTTISSKRADGKNAPGPKSSRRAVATKNNTMACTAQMEPSNTIFDARYASGETPRARSRPNTARSRTISRMLFDAPIQIAVRISATRNGRLLRFGTGRAVNESGSRATMSNSPRTGA